MSESLSPKLLWTVKRELPLVSGRLLCRHHRFLAEVVLDNGQRVTAHCANTGSMETLLVPNSRVWLEPVPPENPRKLRWTWVLVERPCGLFGIDTGYPNRMTGELLRNNKLPFWGTWRTVISEQKYGVNSRVDFLLQDPSRKREGIETLYLEIKNCTLLYPDGYAYFPDGEGKRATKHLHELMDVCKQSGVGAQVLFFAQISALKAVRPSDVHDPEFAATARMAAENGVRFACVQAKHFVDRTEFYGPIPVDLRPYDTTVVRGWRAALPNE